MFSVAVKDHVMIAHSFRGDVFGPAQRLHGATFVVTTEYKAAELNDDGIVIDIGLATIVLSKVLEPLRYRNLDELDEFEGQNTTTEVLCRHIHRRLAKELEHEFKGTLRVVIEESHVAWGSFEGPL